MITKELAVWKFQDTIMDSIEMTKRNMMDFLDGVSNIKPEDRRYHIFTNKDNTSRHAGELHWRSNSTYMCFIRFLIDLTIWRRVPVATKENYYWTRQEHRVSIKL